MKFLCPSCKAKYQVADEKIAGRSLRMKCRKCEYVISLSDAPLAPPTLAPSEGELVPRLPPPPGVPNLAAVPPWSKAAAPAAAQPARRPAPSVRPMARGAQAQAQGATALAAVLADVTPQGDEQAAPAVEEWFVEIKGTPTGPLKLSELREQAGTGDVTLQSLVWRDGADGWKPLASVPELVAIVEERLSRVRAAVTPTAAKATPPPLPVAPAAPSEEAPPPSLGTAHAADLRAAGLGRRRMPITAWLAVVVAMVLGLTIGFVVFGQLKQPEQVVPLAAAVPPETASAGTIVEDAPPAPEVELPAAAPSSGKQAAVSGARPATTPAPRAGDKAANEAAKELPGPTAGLTGPSSESAPSGGPLDSATIESTVARYKASVKRSCWQPALEARADGAPTSARVNVSLTISPSGSVQNVTTSGDPKGYPGLGSCIAGRVRGWQFPPAGTSTPVNVPFVFAGQ